MNDDLELDNDFILPSFNFKIKDYDFDNLNDLYIQRYTTNGLGMSYGYLITIDENLNMHYHKETDNLTNIMPDYRTKKKIRIQYFMVQLVDTFLKIIMNGKTIN